MSNIEARLLKLELCYENLSKEIDKIQSKINDNSITLSRIMSTADSLDKVIKYVVTPLIGILGALVGVGAVIG